VWSALFIAMTHAARRLRHPDVSVRLRVIPGHLPTPAPGAKVVACGLT
jgi:hypothetical protein